MPLSRSTCSRSTRWFGSAGLGFFFLGLAVKTIPIGTAYSVWVGIGIAGSSALGILLFNESATPARLACIAVILLGIVGLKALPSGASP